MPIAKYLVLAAAVVLIVLLRLLYGSGHIHLPVSEVIAYLFVMGVYAWRWGGPSAQLSVAGIRKHLHRKYGFTSIFSLGCALLLTLVGLLWGPPDITRLPVPVRLEGQNGYKVPAVVRAGDSVRLYIQPERRLPQQSISGLWKANVIKVTLVLDEPRRLIPVPGVSSLPPDETWEDVNPKDGKLYFRPVRQDSAIPKFRNEAMVPWIEFTVPLDDMLDGRDAVVHVEMTGMYPYLIQKDEYRTQEFRLIEDVPFYVADAKQFAAFQNYRSQLAYWQQFQRLRYYAAMTFLLCGVIFLALSRRRPGPANIPVRLMSRRIGQ